MTCVELMCMLSSFAFLFLCGRGSGGGSGVWFHMAMYFACLVFTIASFGLFFLRNLSLLY